MKPMRPIPGETPPHDVRLTWLDSPVGRLLLGATADGLAVVEFTDADADSDSDSEDERVASVKRRFGGEAGFAESPGNPILQRTADQLREYFAGQRRGFELPLDARGTTFETDVWAALCRIPYGETRSYEDIALEVGRTGGSQAVGQANGRNPLAIVIPCHRVVNKGGALGGYGGGRERKRFLLGLEQRVGGRIGSTAASDRATAQIPLFGTIPR
jgi:O-6-methylguanine DNA methyltransferase